MTCSSHLKSLKSPVMIVTPHDLGIMCPALKLHLYSVTVIEGKKKKGEGGQNELAKIGLTAGDTFI